MAELEVLVGKLVAVDGLATGTVVVYVSVFLFNGSVACTVFHGTRIVNCESRHTGELQRQLHFPHTMYEPCLLSQSPTARSATATLKVGKLKEKDSRHHPGA